MNFISKAISPSIVVTESEAPSTYVRVGVNSCAGRWVRGLVSAVCLLGCVPLVSAQNVLYFEDFEDEELAPNTTINEGEVIGGVGSFNDDETTDKSVFNVVQDFNSPVMTFAFDVVEPVVPLGDMTQSELLFRAGRGTGTSSIGSADDILELILHRDNGNRGGYLNNGNESVFVVANNNAGPLNFPSPVDGANVALNDQEYVAFIRNNDNGAFVQARAPGAWLIAEPITRFFIGSGSNVDIDTFSIDNVGVYDEIVFSTVVDPGPQLTLRVNPSSGQVTIANLSDEPITFNSYEIISEAGSLDPVGWTPISEQSIPGFPAGDGSGNGWEVGPDSDAGELTEWFLTGDSTLGIGASIDLGSAFAGGTQDLTFQYMLDDGGIKTGLIEYLAVGAEPGDYNQNGVVDAADYTVWRDNFGSATSLANDDSPGVGQDDYTRWKTNFGNGAGSGAALGAGAVPEPSTLAMLALCTFAAGAARRRE